MSDLILTSSMVDTCGNTKKNLKLLVTLLETFNVHPKNKAQFHDRKSNHLGIDLIYVS